MLACAAGIGWKLTGAPLPEPVAHILELLAGAALPLGLLAVGAGLTLARSALPLPALLWWNGVKLVALPAIALALSAVAGLSPLERQIAVVMAAVPTAPSAYILATRMKGDGASVALLISSGTLLAAITLPLWIASDSADPEASQREGSTAFAIEEVRDDALLAAIDRRVERAVGRIVLLCLAERVDRILVVTLRLQCLPEAMPGVRVAELEIGPCAA